MKCRGQKKKPQTQTHNWNPGKTQIPEQNNPSKTSSELFGLCDQQNDTIFKHNVKKREINQKSTGFRCFFSNLTIKCWNWGVLHKKGISKLYLQDISVQNIDKTHTHSLIHTHQFHSRKIETLSTACRGRECVTFLSNIFCVHVVLDQIKSLSSASKAAAISSASELLLPSSSLESLEDSSEDSAAASSFSTSSSSSSLCLRLWPLKRQQTLSNHRDAASIHNKTQRWKN